MTFSTFRHIGMKNRLVDRVVDEIQQQIMEGKLTPGMMLPPERELTEQLGVSRTALREAVRMLVTKGLLETRPGVGTIIKRITSSQITEPLSILINQAGSINLDHLDQLRRILEVEIAEAASREATAEDIENLRTINDQFSAARGDPEEFAALDAQFHRALAESTHNPLLAILLDTIHDLMDNIRHLVQKYPHLADEVIPDHEMLFRSVEGRDTAAARTAMLNHLEHARRIQSQILATNQD